MDDLTRTEWERYMEYYRKQRLESGVPSMFEAYWAGHVSAAYTAMNKEAPEGTSSWLNDTLMSRFALPEMVYKRMVDEMATCFSCGLGATRTKIVPGQGPLRTDLMFVGEAPGADEDASGDAFVGRAGRAFFDDLLPKYMFRQRNSVFIANCLKCRPPSNRDPEPSEMIACQHFLHRQIMLVNPKMIIALGKHAGRSLTGQPVNTLEDVHGKVFWYQHIPVAVMPHPAAYLRDTEKWGPKIYQTSQWALWILNQPYDSDYWEKAK